MTYHKLGSQKMNTPVVVGNVTVDVDGKLTEARVIERYAFVPREDVRLKKRGEAMSSRTKSAAGRRSRKSQRKRKSQQPKRARTAKGSAATFTVKLAEDGAYYVLMDGNASAPPMHIGNFASEDAAQAWIREESAAWFAKRGATRM